VNREGKFNNDATILGHVGANSLTGRLRLGKEVLMPDGSSLSASSVEVGNGSSVDKVFTNDLKLGVGAVVRNGVDTVTLPLVDPFCEIPDFQCGGPMVFVKPGETLGPLPPGVYGHLRIMNGATIKLAAGEFTFCDVRMGREATLEAHGPVLMKIDGSVRIGTDSFFGPVFPAPPIVAFVSGTKVRISQNGVAIAKIIAPFARGSFGRDARFEGCFCMEQSKSDKHITLLCPETP
jgi:hypothetical protein